MRFVGDDIIVNYCTDLTDIKKNVYNLRFALIVANDSHDKQGIFLCTSSGDWSFVMQTRCILCEVEIEFVNA